MSDEDFTDDCHPGDVLRAEHGSSISALVDRSINKPLPWIAMAIAASFLALGYSWNAKEIAIVKADAARAQAEVAAANAKTEAAKASADAKAASELARIAERQSTLTNYYLMDPHSRTPQELAAWAKFNKEHER